MRDADPADGAPRTCNVHAGVDGLARADALEHRMGSLITGKLVDASNAFLAPLGDDVGCPEGPGEGGAVSVTAHHDNLLGAETLGAMTPQRLTAPSPTTTTR